MNEALLVLLCLKYEIEVFATKQYKHSAKKKGKPYREIVADWKLQQLIEVAEENNWIPSDIVNEEVKIALADCYPELMSIIHPEWSQQKIAQNAESSFQCPGIAIMKITQDLRNDIHAGRWMRSKRQFAPEHFGNCGRSELI